MTTHAWERPSERPLLAATDEARRRGGQDAGRPPARSATARAGYIRLVWRLVTALVLAALLAACGGGAETTTVGETETVTETATRTVTETATKTVTETEPGREAAPVGLPAPVAEAHGELLAAAETGDYEALRPLIPSGFSYTFGAPDEGGPIAYWQRVEKQSDERPIEILARVLRMPYTLANGTYVWPFAYDKRPEDLTEHERQLLGDLAELFGAGSGYLGWRAGIEPDGSWRFFIAGD